MRTTLTVEDQVDRHLRQLAQQEHLSYKDAVNLALTRGLDQLLVSEAPRRYRVIPFDAGFQGGVDLGHLNGLADELETEG